MKSRLLNRKSDSRESNDRIWFSPFNSSQCLIKSASEATDVIPMKAKNNGPIADSAKAWTEERTPDRVRKVPKMTSA